MDDDMLDDKNVVEITDPPREAAAVEPTKAKNTKM